jgi:hypothetical protein
VVDWLLQSAVYRVTRDDLTPPLVIRLEKETHDRT